jgi:hypothetical protein
VNVKIWNWIAQTITYYFSKECLFHISAYPMIRAKKVFSFFFDYKRKEGGREGTDLQVGVQFFFRFNDQMTKELIPASSTSCFCVNIGGEMHSPLSCFPTWLSSRDAIEHVFSQDVNNKGNDWSRGGGPKTQKYNERLSPISFNYFCSHPALVLLRILFFCLTLFCMFVFSSSIISFLHFCLREWFFFSFVSHWLFRSRLQRKLMIRLNRFKLKFPS